jgi:hypothetical protein
MRACHDRHLAADCLERALCCDHRSGVGLDLDGFGPSAHHSVDLRGEIGGLHLGEDDAPASLPAAEEEASYSLEVTL